MIQYMGKEANMFDHWGKRQCPIIPTNLTPVANAGIASQVQQHSPPGEFVARHKARPEGGLIGFSDGKYAWDLPTKRSLNPGEKASILLMQVGLSELGKNLEQLEELGIEVLLIPRIGAGLGGLPWGYVWHHCGPVIETIAGVMDVMLYTERPRGNVKRS